MKYQHLAVIFIIIIVPISLVLSEYLHVHIKTIENQTQYTTNLLNATYGASQSFQINTAKNRFSTLGDSKARDITASVNTFYNILATSLSGYSSDDLKDYTPAILCNLYDGYYIYTKYYDTELKNTDGTIGGYTYGLKPFISYSCRYIKGQNDFVVNYTLDNTITIIGKVNNAYVTKTGHLIKFEEWMEQYTTEYININNAKTELETKIQTNYGIKKEKLEENLIILKDDGSYEKSKEITETKNGVTNTYIIPESESFQYIVYNNQKVYKDDSNNLNVRYFYYSTDCTKNYVTTVSDVNAIAKIFNDGGSDSAIKYYEDAIIFTNWVNKNLGTIKASNAVDSNGEKIKDFATDLGESSPIFKTDKDNNDPLLSSSTFNEHRMNVIRRSIETNLVPAIANYNNHSTTGYEFAMPKISEDEWYKIENNVCFVSFLQGMPIGSKTYNNYCVVANNTNQETIGENSIYIKTNDGEYHKPGCKKLIEKLNNETIEISGAYSASDFVRQSVSLTGEGASASKQLTGTDTNDTAYFFPQEGTACYDCIVNIADTYSTDDIIKGTIEIKDGNVTKTIIVPKQLKQSYLQALARCRYDLYTVNGYFGVK